MWLAGHQDLVVARAEVGHDPVFKCRVCGAAWRRHHLAGDAFSWHPARRVRDKSEAAGHVALGARRLRLVKALIESRLGERLTVADMANALNLSRFHFVRSFKAETGSTPHQYLLQARLERARDLLLNPELTIAQVGARVGYRRPGDFTKAFTRRFGRTPSAFRRRHLGKKPRAAGR